jgi:hypothetical protein
VAIVGERVLARADTVLSIGDVENVWLTWIDRLGAGTGVTGHLTCSGGHRLETWAYCEPCQRWFFVVALHPSIPPTLCPACETMATQVRTAPA